MYKFLIVQAQDDKIVGVVRRQVCFFTLKWERSINMENSLYKKFKLHWKNYVFQSLVATFAVFIVILVLNINREPIIIASIGATVFIIFALPNTLTAKPRNVIGGQLVGIACGFICCLLPHELVIHGGITSSLIYAMAVGMSFFVMVITDTEHPPGAATALGIVSTSFSWAIALTVMASAVILSAIHISFKKYLRDLT